MNKHQRTAFTLVELIVVLAILAVLLVVIVPRVSGYVTNARETAAQNNASAILRAAELYVVEQERDGLTPAATLSSGGDLDSYIENLNDEDSYQLTLTYNVATSQYDISGTYTSGGYTVAIPEMTVSKTESTAP